MLEVAPDLIGTYLMRRIDGVEYAYQITEVEAYDGEYDLASHASKGRTKRTEVMYGEPGHWYVYFIYGMYQMLNVVCGPMNHPSAVLIRGVKGFDGPGKLTRGLRIDRSFYGLAAIPENDLWIEDRGHKPDLKDVHITPRIGIAYAGAWVDVPYRFVWKK